MVYMCELSVIPGVYLRLQFTFNINSSSCTPVYCCSPSTLGALIIFKLVGNEEKVKATGDS